MTEQSVNFKIPSIIWPAAVVTSVALAILEAVGIAHCPWWVALLPIGLVVGAGLAIIVAAFVALLVIGGVITIVDAIKHPKKAKLAPVRRIR